MNIRSRVSLYPADPSAWKCTLAIAQCQMRTVNGNDLGSSLCECERVLPFAASEVKHSEVRYIRPFSKESLDKRAPDAGPKSTQSGHTRRRSRLWLGCPKLHLTD